MGAASKKIKQVGLENGFGIQLFQESTGSKRKEDVTVVKCDWDVCLHCFQLQSSREMYVTVA